MSWHSAKLGAHWHGQSRVVSRRRIGNTLREQDCWPSVDRVSARARLLDVGLAMPWHDVKTWCAPISFMMRRLGVIQSQYGVKTRVPHARHNLAE